MTKTCAKCNETKEYSEFNMDRSKKDGKQAYCRPCSIRAVQSHPRTKYKKMHGHKQYEKLKNHPLRKEGLTIKEIRATLKLLRQAEEIIKS